MRRVAVSALAAAAVASLAKKAAAAGAADAQNWNMQQQQQGPMGPHTGGPGPLEAPWLVVEEAGEADSSKQASVTVPFLDISTALAAANDASLTATGSFNSAAEELSIYSADAAKANPVQQVQQQRQQLRQLQELQLLLPLASQLAQRIDTAEAAAALEEIRQNVARGKRVQQQLLPQHEQQQHEQQQHEQQQQQQDSYSEVVLQAAIDSSVSALSVLYELTRQRGVSLSEETEQHTAAAAAAASCWEDIESLRSVDESVSSALQSHLESLHSQQQVYIQQAQQAGRSLLLLPPFRGLGDWQQLATAAAAALFIEKMQEAAAAESRAALHLAATVRAVALLHLLRQQTCMYRAYRDILEGRQIICKAKLQQQLSLPEGDRDAAAIQALAAAQQQLQRGERLLHRYSRIVDVMRKKENVKEANATAQQASEVAEKLEMVLDGVSMQLEAIPEAPAAAAAAQSMHVQQIMQKITWRAFEDAAAAKKRAAGIQSRLLEKYGLPDQQEQQQQQQQQQERGKDGDVISPFFRKQLGISLMGIERRATAIEQAFNAAAGIIQKSTSSTSSTSSSSSSSSFAAGSSMGMVLAARGAATDAESLLDEVEMLWLKSQLVEAIEEDISLSLSVAKVAATAAQQQQQLLLMNTTSPDSSLLGPPAAAATAAAAAAAAAAAQTQPDPRQQELLLQLNKLAKDARTQTKIKDLIAVAAAIKDIAAALASNFQEKQAAAARVMSA
ncbi:hypothetical protein, conserved [Eimeria brunetti]|uniref:BRO1 domain-containing protein n=1 Tax=Eimeria brunetti TaxID=51314 RepID=U6LE43_9EIME|nr:hypothetical protein, conserved [Eimeria brunetti]